jgi:serine/threonine protein kinase
MAFAEGLTLSSGRYDIVEKIGEGGMGQVWRARDNSLKREVAIKVLPPGAPRSLQEFFENEAQAMARARSEHVLEIYDVGRLQGEHEAPYFIMELIDPSRSLADIAEELRADLVSALRLFIQATEGLGAIHHARLVHRDVKPSNLLVALRPESGRRVLKLADFGIALQRDRSREDQSAAGTLGYAAPEQLALGFVDVRADIYALGATMYAILSGQRPHKREVLFEWLGARSTPGGELVRLPSPKPLFELNSRVPGPLAEIVARCLEERLDKRFRGMAELRGALESVLERDLGAAVKERVGPPPDPRDEALEILLGLADAILIDERVIEPERLFLRRRALALGVPEYQADSLVAEVIERSGCRMVRARTKTNPLATRGSDEATLMPSGVTPPPNLGGGTLVGYPG